MSYLREIFGRFVSRLCYSIDLSFYLRCLATPCTPNPSHAPSISLLFSLPPWLFAYICLSLPSFLMRPTSSWPLILSSFRILHLIVPPPCILVPRRYPSCCHTKHLLSSSHYHRAVLLPPFLNTLQQSSFAQHLLPKLYI